MQRLSNYRKIERSEIGDPNEGLSGLHQADQIKSFRFNGKEIKKQIVGSVKMRVSNTPNPFIFPSYALTEKQFVNTKNNIDKRCLEFGDTALLITDFTEFHKRIAKNINETDGIYRGLVKYIDDKTFNGRMSVFNKFKGFNHQNEYRIALYRNSKNDTLKFNIGSLKDISEIYPSSILLDGLTYE
ncbi:MAG: hypothetical protein DRQ51_06820 [Gammaproteobacteria bacterium]|nr:MAG: hypothetical protein DRQ51_06820 [Gammaproteobacteria bacterium]